MPDPCALRRTEPRLGRALGPYGAAKPPGGMACCVHFPLQEDIPSSTLGISLPPTLPSYPPRLQPWLSPIPKGPPLGTRLTPSPPQSCQCCVCSPHSPGTWSSRGGKGGGRSSWLPRGRWMWRCRLPSRPPPPPHYIPLCCHHGVAGAAGGGGAARYAICVPVARRGGGGGIGN